MCGLTGVIGNLFMNDVSFFKDMMYMTGLRGKHATGIAGIEYNGEWRLQKGAMRSCDFLDMKVVDTALTSSKVGYIGHCRHATQGSQTAANAHPFEFKDIVGAHNGTIPFDWKRELPDYNQFETDSEALFNSIQELGIEATIGKIQGAYALTWYDRSENTINFLRNSERPFYYVFSKSGQTMYWASEFSMLYCGIERNHLNVEKVQALAENTVMSWTVPKVGQVFGQARRIKVSPAPDKYKYTNGYHGNAYGFDEGYRDNHFQTLKEGEEATTSGKAHGASCICLVCKPTLDLKPAVSVTTPIEGEFSIIKPASIETARVRARESSLGNVHFLNRKIDNRPITYFDEENNILNKKEFTQRTSGGCLFCRADIQWQDPVIFVKGGAFCKSHIDDTDEINAIAVEKHRVNKRK